MGLKCSMFLSTAHQWFSIFFFVTAMLISAPQKTSVPNLHSIFFKLNKTTILNFYNLQHNRGNSQNTSVPLNNVCKALVL